jgi:hypothetical protein
LVKVVPAEPGHIPYIAEHMRQSDQLEIWLSGMSKPLRALQCGLRDSTKCWTAFVDDQPALMFGVAEKSLLTRVGTPWLLGTDGILKIKREFLVRSHHFLEDMTQGYALLENYVHDENVVSKRWLTSLGFDIGDIQYVGPFGQPFRRFEMRIHNV